MKKSKSYRSSLVVKAALLLTLGFLLIGTGMWLFFKNELRDIGYYLRFGRRDEMALLISEYLGDPPSRFKARMLAQTYGVIVIYRERGRIRWVVEKGQLFRPREPFIESMQHAMMRRMMDNRHGDAGRNMLLEHVPIGPDRVISFIFPPPFMGSRSVAPFIVILFIGLLVGSILFVLLRRTFSPLDRIIEASKSIGEGDLSHRIEYGRGDDFDKVATAFNTMTAKLSSMFTNQRDLLHFISHELRTPLARIRLALELKDSRRSYALIKDEVEEIDSLIGEVSELSRLDNMDRETGRKEVDLVSLLQELTGKTEKTVLFDHARERAVVLINPLLIRKAISNLLDNAAKYSPEGETPVVTLREQAGGWEIAIQNNGPGISERELEKIWEPFYRGANTAVTGAEGRGLGLVVVRRSVELCGGSIEVSSSANGPTLFRLWLPAQTPS
jgi:two-component system sensor histidine kinase CpxA